MEQQYVLPDWKRRQIEQGVIQKVKEDKEKEQRLKKLEQIKRLQSTSLQRSLSVTDGGFKRIEKKPIISTEEGDLPVESHPAGNEVNEIKQDLVSQEQTSPENRTNLAPIKPSEAPPQAMVSNLKNMWTEKHRRPLMRVASIGGTRPVTSSTNEINENESPTKVKLSKKAEMAEELDRLRKMQEDIEKRHSEYLKRLEKKLKKKNKKKAEVEAELSRTRQRLFLELDNVEKTKSQLTAEIATLKSEAGKKIHWKRNLTKSKR